jgi:type IV pilus assembly protein PilB
MGDPETVLSDPILQTLHEQGVITPEQIQALLENQQASGKPSRTLLVEMGFLSEQQVMEVVAGYLGARILNLPATDIPPDVVHRVPPSVARMHSVVPVTMTPDNVELAVCDIVTPQVMDELMFVLACNVSFVVVREEDLRTFINQFYGDDSGAVNEMLAALESEIKEVDAVDVSGGDDTKGLEEAAGSAPVIKFVNLILFQAINDRASDIHFEPFEKEFKIRYRVDGALYEMAPPPRRLALPVISRVKVMSGLNIAERRLPQDGRIQLTIGGRAIDLRVSTLPTQYGESVVLRVLDRSVVSLEIENLGMPDDIYQMFTHDIDKPNGIIIVTGPTGSGKTTTLYSGLKRINTVEQTILTAEEPVEYDIDGLVQVPISQAVGNTFAAVLRAFLRQDPDVIMVGEIRDLETAQIAIQASLTGHLVFSTLHTNDSAGAVTRLIDMDVEPFLLASTLEAVLGQRLVRTICPQCKAPYKPGPDVLKLMQLKDSDVGDRNFYAGAGCQNCNNVGYKGRRGIYEYLVVSPAIREMITERRPTLIIRDKAIEQGMRTMRQDGVRNVLDGYTTVEEVIKYT